MGNKDLWRNEMCSAFNLVCHHGVQNEDDIMWHTKDPFTHFVHPTNIIK